jgi:hypothetical protein
LLAALPKFCCAVNSTLACAPFSAGGRNSIAWYATAPAVDPKKFLDALDLKIKNNDISKTDADQIRSNIELASKIYKSTYFGYTPQKLDANQLKLEEQAQKNQYDELVKSGVDPKEAAAAVADNAKRKTQDQPLDDAGKRELLFLKMQHCSIFYLRLLSHQYTFELL